MHHVLDLLVILSEFAGYTHIESVLEVFNIPFVEVGDSCFIPERHVGQDVLGDLVYLGYVRHDFSNRPENFD